ncbi:MAG: hypothetical protein V1848_00635 [Candidatus Magasanikbacteria bacterium]
MPGEGIVSEITLEQVGELIAQGKAGRITREMLQGFLRDPQSVNGQPSDYIVSVDFSRTLEKMVYDGHYDFVEDKERFPIIDGEGVTEVTLQLVSLKWNPRTPEEVYTYLEEQGLRPATLAELLAFGATYPEVQRGKFLIMCLGGDCPSGFPYLGSEFPSYRTLKVMSSRGFGDYPLGRKFLAVRK